ncbi:ZCHC3 protein, partial [Atractosteus spatula]|nr:ZCHC3 protein [Atractosteus spatula]
MKRYIRGCLLELRTRKKETFLRDYEVLGCYNDNFRVVIVHLYDPFIGDDDVTAFLLRHVTVMGQPEKIMDSCNIWTGKRKYRVLLRSDARGAGGFHHPPALTHVGQAPSILFFGFQQGLLFYQNQPQFCRKCCNFGHHVAECRENVCTICDETGHVARECRKKVCTLCVWKDTCSRAASGETYKWHGNMTQAHLEWTERRRRLGRKWVWLQLMREHKRSSFSSKQGTVQLVTIWTTKTLQCRKRQKASRNLGK